MIVITGGGSGIGRALAQELASRGKEVLIVGRRKSLLVETSKFSDKIFYTVADLATEVGRADIQQHLQHKEVSALVHNAGTIKPIAPLNDIAFSDFEHIFKVNLFAPFMLNQVLISKLQGARVLHIGTGAAYMPIAGWAGYCASKAALSMLTRCYQLEYDDPAFASVMPGIVDTAMTAEIRSSKAGMSKEALAFHTSLYKEGRLIKAETVALFLAWLLLDISKTEYVACEWDIYDKKHHKHWLRSPHKVSAIS